MSRIGKKPVEIPAGVSVSLSGQTVVVTGPKGELSFTATDDVTVKVNRGAHTLFLRSPRANNWALGPVPTYQAYLGAPPVSWINRRGRRGGRHR